MMAAALSNTTAAGSSSGPSAPALNSPKPGPGPRSRHAALQQKHSYPLPIILPFSTSLKSKPSDHASRSILSSFIPTLLPSTSSRGIEVPTCIGVYDPSTRSVWVTDEKSKEILFARGFFGKGSLSRSEPSWRQRRVDLLKGGESLMAEQIREKRRIERKKFKIDRAVAMFDAAKAAEAVLVSGVGVIPSSSTSEAGGEVATPTNVGGEADGVQQDTSVPPSPAPSSTTNLIDVTTLTPQTFLVRPTRPDANRNRGKKAFKRRPAQGQAQAQTHGHPSADTSAGTASPVTDTQAASSTGRTDPVKPAAASVEVKVNEDEEPELCAGDIEELVQDMEHLQLGTEEAWFLSSALGVLKVYDPVTEAYPPIPALLTLFLTPLSTPSPMIDLPISSQGLASRPPLYPDDPFLVSYVAYHHYRSLGWVVKPGIKFCCDWLLYRKGPAFSHSAFSLLLVPVHASPSDLTNSPHANTDWYTTRISWKWINTVMRVNSLVQKTVVLVYITIPSIDSFPATMRKREGDGGGLEYGKVGMKGLLERYSVREVSLTRFGPARRRD